MRCKNNRRDCPCDPRVWNRQTVVARFAFMMGKAFPEGSAFDQIEGLFTP